MHDIANLILTARAWFAKSLLQSTAYLNLGFHTSNYMQTPHLIKMQMIEGEGYISWLSKSADLRSRVVRYL